MDLLISIVPHSAGHGYSPLSSTSVFDKENVVFNRDQPYDVDLLIYIIITISKSFCFIFTSTLASDPIQVLGP